MTQGFTRREAIATGASLAVTAVSGAAFAKPETRRLRKIAPSDKVNLAIVGAGGKGSDDAVRLVSQYIVAICDVDYDHVLGSLKNRKGEITPEKQPVKAAYDKEIGRAHV